MDFKPICKYWLVLLTLLALSASAADLTVDGSIGSELYSSPETGFIAGMRYQVYTTVRSKTRPINVRVIAFYQNEEEIREFKQANWLSFTPTIDWASVSLRGNLYHNGPLCTLNIGNIVAEYSPFLWWLSDDLELDFRTPKPRGISLEKLKLGNFEVDGLSVWEALEPNDSRNTIGVRIAYNPNRNSRSEIIYLNTGQRSQLQEKPQIAYSLDLTRKIGMFNLGVIYASEENETETSELIDSNISVDVDDYKLSLFYRNYSQGFNPAYRLTRPEFDPQTGKYLGWNPVDKYSGLVGTQLLFLDNETQGKNLYSSYEKYHNIKDGTDLNIISFKINVPIKSSTIQFRTKLNAIHKEIGFGIPSHIESSITEIIYEKPLRGDLKLLLSNRNILEEDDRRVYGTYGLKGVTKLGASWEAGRRSLPNNKQWYSKMKYTSPNGINVQWNYASPEIPQTSKYDYDDEYNLIEWDNLLRIWVEVDF